MIGVLGGTFDPIHLGHLRPALEILQDLPLQAVRFIPLRTAVHRTQPVATAAQRLAMVRIAVAGQPGFIVDDRELRRTGNSYSYDTLASLRAELGPRLPICLLMGLDAFAELPTWHRWRDIAELAHLVVMRRPGAEAVTAPELQRWMEPRSTRDPAALARVPGGSVLFRDLTQLDISATTIRARITLGLSPRFLLPEGVLAFIEREGLYRPDALPST